MAYLSKDETALFVHIYKTGGMSIRKLLPEGKEFGSKHVEAKYLKKYFEGYNRAFKFAFIRNPYTWLGSLYHYIRRVKAHDQNSIVITQTPDRFIEYLITTLMNRKNKEEGDKYLTQYDFIFVDGKLAIDYVGRTETMKQDVLNIAKHINISTNLENINANPSSIDYENIFSPNTKKIIQRVFSKDFEIWESLKN